MRSDKKQNALAVRPQSETYEVGYGKPPDHTRFRKGRSGNPKGRPRGAKNKTPALHEERLKSIILEEAYRTIKVNDGDSPVSVPMAQAVIRSLAVNAAKGNQRAQRLFTELLTTTERENARLHNEWLEVAITYKVEWEKELARRERLGITDLPDPLPHPDHVVVDVRNNNVRIAGPMSKEEKKEWDMWLGRKKEFEKELTELRQLLIDEPLPVPQAGRGRHKAHRKGVGHHQADDRLDSFHKGVYGFQQVHGATRGQTVTERRPFVMSR